MPEREKMDNHQDALLTNKRIRIFPNYIRRIKRSLQGKGQINVQVGQEVAPSEIIGQYTISGGYRRINLSKILNSNPVTAVKFLQRQIGQRIYKGEMLASKPSTLLHSKKVMTAPLDGVLDSYDDKTGDLTLSFLPKLVELPAAVYGIVELVDLLRGEVVIKTQVTDILGVLGTGKSRDGILTVIGGRGDLMTSARLSSKYSEKVIVGGSLIYSEALAAAISFGVHGIITGGINSEDYRSMTGGVLELPLKIGRDVGVSLIVSEGFGSVPIGEDIYQILQSYDGRFVIADGNRARLTLPSLDPNSMLKIRGTQLLGVDKELLVESIKDLELAEVSVGQKVRIITLPFLGEQGKIIAIDQMPTLLPTGISSWLVTIETKSRKLKMPHVNLEIIGEM